MMFWRYACLAAVFFAGPYFLSPVLAAAPQQTLVIGLIPEMNVFKQMERFKPLAGYLSEETGIEIRLTILSRYGNIIESVKKGKMDGAFFGSFTGALAIEQMKVVPLVRPVNLSGESTYRGLIYVRKDSAIKGIADMKGKKFAFVDKATTAGYIFPLAWLRRNGITDFTSFFSEYFFSGSHDASIHAVLNRKADIGASKNTIYNFERRKDPRIDQELVVIASSAGVPSNGLCVRGDLDEEIKAKLKKALQEMDKSARGREVLEKFGARQFVETHAGDYLPVIKMAEQAGIDLKKYNYINQ